MNNRHRMEDVYMSTLHNIDTTVRQLEAQHQELSKSVNQRLGTLESKVDLLLSLFSDYKPTDQQRSTFERSALVNGELSSDSGHRSTSTPSVDNSPNLPNGHVYEGDLSNISSEYATLPSTFTANSNTESGQSSRADGMVKESYSDPEYDQQTQEKLTPGVTGQEAPFSADDIKSVVDDEVITSIQETVVEPVRSKDERLGRRLKGNFGLSKSRPRSPSPLPTRSERILVPYAKFKKLKTRPTEDNRAKYFEQALDITHEDGYQQNAHTEAERAQETPIDTTTLVQQILSQQQREAESSEDVRASDGLDTIICIDTSTSMAGDPLKKAQGLLDTFLDGIETAAADYELEENIAVVTFGKENRIVQHLTNDYDNVRETIENLQTGGSSPLWLGLALSLTELSARGKVLELEHRQLPPRIVLVTDGFATAIDSVDVLEKMEPDKQVDQTIAALVNMNLGTINAILPIIVSSVYNQESLTGLATMTNGSLITNDGQLEQLHEYFRMQRTLDNILKKFGNAKVTEKDLQVQLKKKSQGLSDSSVNAIIESIKSDINIIKEEEHVSESVVEKDHTTITTKEPEAEKLNFTLLPGWSRVRVTPNWSGNPDRHGLVGTVISTRKKGKVKVLWDNEIQETVKFGEGGVYDVHVVNEPKLLAKDETIAVGVYVVRGPDWRWQNQDGGEGSIGVVTKIENGNVVHVVWPDGKLGNYRFGYGGKFDIQVRPNQNKPAYVIWEFTESSGDSWDMFPEDFMNEIESLYQTDPNMKSELTTNDTTYILDLESMKIIDGKSADLPWNIRRRVMTDKEYRKYTDELAGLE